MIRPGLGGEVHAKIAERELIAKRTFDACGHALREFRWVVAWPSSWRGRVRNDGSVHRIPPWRRLGAPFERAGCTMPQVASHDKSLDWAR